MSVYKITFSPTGGTQRAADSFTQAFCRDAVPVDLSDRSVNFEEMSFRAEDVCVVSVPSFGGRVPAAAVSRLARMKGGRARAVLLAVYGNRAYDDTLLELRDTLAQADFRCAAAISAVAEHSIMHQFAAGRPDADDRRELAAFAERIRREMEAGTLSENVEVPGGRPYRAYGGVPMVPSAGRSCTKCGLCAAKCPVNAIAEEDPSRTDKAKCISCMRCIAICPAGARSVSKLLVAAGAQKMKKACMGRKENELFL